jgi:hypothetical protein
MRQESIVYALMVLVGVGFVIKITFQPCCQTDSKTWWRFNDALELFDN